MFSFFKRSSDKEEKKILEVKYLADFIKIEIDYTLISKRVSDLYKNLFQELFETNLCKIVDDGIELDYNSLYSLDDECISMLMLPELFSGEMEVSHTNGTLSQNAIFHTLLKQDGYEIYGFRVIQTILKISSIEYYILPYEFAKSFALIDNAHQTKLSDDRYSVVEYVKSSKNKKLSYTSLLKNDNISSVKKIGIDIVENAQGDLKLLPLIDGLNTEDINNNQNLIYQNQNKTLMLTKVENGNINRYVLDTKRLEIAKKILKEKTIPKDKAEAFLKNPEAFFNELEDGDVSKFRINRIVGLTTEVYTGFFSSQKLDTPLSEVLNAVDIENLDININNLINELSDNQREELINDIEIAKENNQTVVEVGGYTLDIDNVENILYQEIKLDDEVLVQSELILDIEHNDEVSVEDETIFDLSKIEISDKKYTKHWDNLLYIPKEHQVVALNWLISLYKNSFKGGLLADDMGLGKTFQIISFLNYLYNVKKPKIDAKSKRILIVAPAILLNTWKDEIESCVKDRENFRVVILQGRSNAIYKLRELVKDNQTLNLEEETQNMALNDIDVINLLKHNIMITTYETLSNYQLTFAQQYLFNFEVMIFDEAQKIKNPNTRVSQASKAISANIPFKIMATGTPIENELRDLWSIFDTFDPKFIGTWQEFKKRYVNKIDDLSQVENRLREKISNYMLRRLKDTHITELPKKEYKNIYIKMDKKEVEKHNEIVSTTDTGLVKLQKLKMLSLHKSLLDIDNHKNIIELDNIINKFFTTSKMKKLIEILNIIKMNNEKVLIFVIRHSMQTLLQSALNSHYNLNIDILNGQKTSKNIDEKLNDFKRKDGFNILLLSPLSAGMGITVTEANHIVHLERHYNPAKEDQASDRVYRIGQNKDVSIYHILHKSDDFKTFDMGLKELIESKKGLSNRTLIPTFTTVSDNELIENFTNIIEE